MILQKFLIVITLLCITNVLSYSNYIKYVNEYFNRNYNEQQKSSNTYIRPYTSQVSNYRSKNHYKEPVPQQKTIRQIQSSEPKCGIIKPQITNYIANGWSIDHKAQPWYVQVIITSSDGAEAYCGGTIIEKKGKNCAKCTQWIVTAAHCFDDIETYLLASSTTIRLKSVKIHNRYTNKFNAVEIQATEVLINPEYIPAMTLSQAEELGIKPGPIKDIALIKICIEDPTINAQIIPACLPNPHYQILPGTKCKILGHGFTDHRSERDFSMPEKLQEADIVISKNKQCRAQVDSQSIKDKINSETLCIEGKVHPCVGDSGGPLMCKGHSPGKKELEILGEKDYDYDYSPYLSYKEDSKEERFFLCGVTSFAVSTDMHDVCGHFKSAVFGEVSGFTEWMWSCMEKSSALRFRPQRQLYKNHN